MSGFVLHLQGATQYERVEDCTSFVGEDASGSFGIWPGRARLLTVQVFGMARFRRGAGAWEFLALPGAVIQFRHPALMLSTRRYLRDPDVDRIQQALQHELRAEEEQLGAMRNSLRRLEREMLKQLWELQRREAAA